MKHQVTWITLLGLLLSGNIYAAETANGEAAKTIVTQVCAACHGLDGNSTNPANPKLAGQHAEYLAKQLRNFKITKDKSDDARQNPVMTGMVANLSDSDIKNLSVYFANQRPQPGTATSKDFAVKGEKIFRGGVSETGVPACGSCHSPNGNGIPAQYPRLAGQHPEYTLAQLKAFRSGDRANDVNKMMRMIAIRMTDQEMQAVSQYIAALK